MESLATDGTFPNLVEAATHGHHGHIFDGYYIHSSWSRRTSFHATGHNFSRNVFWRRWRRFKKSRFARYAGALSMCVGWPVFGFNDCRRYFLFYPETGPSKITLTKQPSSKHMNIDSRILSATILLCITAFCVFGFLASFERGSLNVGHLVYGACGIGTLFLAVRLLLWGIKTSRAIIAAAGLFFLAVLLLFLYATNRTHP